MLWGHSQDLAAAMPLIRRIRPALWKAIDPDADSARECAELGVRLIVRHYGPWDTGNPMPHIAPLPFVEGCAAQPWFPHAWAIETPNEPHYEDSTELGHYVTWMHDVWRILRSYGKECVVGNWGTGWDGFYVPGATYYSSHEYGWPDVLSQAPWHALRYRGWFPQLVLSRNPAARLLITEFGVTQAVLGLRDVGWRSDGRQASEYAESVLAYRNELRLDPYVLGAFLYQVGGFPDWETFECLGEPELEGLITANGADVEQGPLTTGAITAEEHSMRTGEQQNVIDVVRGWGTVLQKAVKAGPRKQAAKELRDCADILERLFPFR